MENIDKKSTFQLSARTTGLSGAALCHEQPRESPTELQRPLSAI